MGSSVEERGVYGLVPLHWPPAPFTTGPVANGTYIEVGTPAANASGPAAVPHQLHCMLIVLGEPRGHEKRMAETKLLKSLPLFTRLLVVADELSRRTTEWA